MMHSKVIDRLPLADIRRTQDALLAKTVEHACSSSPYYSKVFHKCGLSPSDVKGVDDIRKIPLTDKKDIQDDNEAFFAVPQADMAEVVSTTGTTGEPVFVALTEGDLQRLACNERRNFLCAGAARGDLYHIAVTCDNLFIAGIAYYSGLKKLGASVVRVGPQNITRHLDLMRKLRPAGIVAVPSFVVAMSRRMKQTGVTAGELGIRKIVLIGDSIRNDDFTTNALGGLIEAEFGDICVSTYGITEAQLSFCECSVRRGLHSHPDFVLVEIVDERGNILADGDIGELVLTPLQIEGMPLLRYKTGDITFKMSDPCPCGRHSARIGPILGRRRHKLKVKGVTLYPKNIENALIGAEGIVNYQIEAYTGSDMTDNIIVRVGSHRRDRGFVSLLREMLAAKARVTPEVEVDSPEEIQKRLFEGGCRKAITFKDRRVNGYG